MVVQSNFYFPIRWEGRKRASSSLSLSLQSGNDNRPSAPISNRKWSTTFRVLFVFASIVCCIGIADAAATPSPTPNRYVLPNYVIASSPRLVLACFSPTRSLFSFCSSSAFGDARILLNSYFSVTYVPLNEFVFPGAYYDAVVLDSSTPLSIDEQQALLNYITAGGNAMLFAVQIFTSDFSAVNSILYPLGLYTNSISVISSVVSYSVNASAVPLASQSLVEGSFGNVTSFSNRLEANMLVPLASAGNTFALMGASRLAGPANNTQQGTLLHFPRGSRGSGQALVVGHFIAFADASFFPSGLISSNFILFLNFFGVATDDVAPFRSVTPTLTATVTPTATRTVPDQGPANSAPSVSPSATPFRGYFCSQYSDHEILDFDHCSRYCGGRSSCYDCCAMFSSDAILLQLCRQSCHNRFGQGSAFQDPHFRGFGGERFDFTGEPDHVFNLVSDRWLQLNAYFIGTRSRQTYLGAFGVKASGLPLYIGCRPFDVLLLERMQAHSEQYQRQQQHDRPLEPVVSSTAKPPLDSIGKTNSVAANPDRPASAAADSIPLGRNPPIPFATASSLARPSRLDREPQRVPKLFLPSVSLSPSSISTSNPVDALASDDSPSEWSSAASEDVAAAAETDTDADDDFSVNPNQRRRPLSLPYSPPADSSSDGAPLVDRLSTMSMIVDRTSSTLAAAMGPTASSSEFLDVESLLRYDAIMLMESGFDLADVVGFAFHVRVFGSCITNTSTTTTTTNSINSPSKTTAVPAATQTRTVSASHPSTTPDVVLDLNLADGEELLADRPSSRCPGERVALVRKPCTTCRGAVRSRQSGTSTGTADGGSEFALVVYPFVFHISVSLNDRGFCYMNIRSSHDDHAFLSEMRTRAASASAAAAAASGGDGSGKDRLLSSSSNRNHSGSRTRHEADWMPHGILGQTLNARRKVGNGSKEGLRMLVGQDNQGGGIVEGAFGDYRLVDGDLFGNSFRFNRYRGE